MSKLVIAGGRDYYLTIRDYATIDTIMKKHGVTEIVSGGASGADSCGSSYAKLMGITCTKFPANWKLHGRAAGPLRNKEMAEYADVVVVFPGGAGSKSMCREAEQRGCRLYNFMKGVDTDV